MKSNDGFVIHVNADYPEHVDFAFQLALEYRMKFKRDVCIDVSGYRKYGHNEQDMPKFTQPRQYDLIEKKTPMWKLYSQQLVSEGVFTQAEIDAKYNKFIGVLDQAFEKSKHDNFDVKTWDSSTWKNVMDASKSNTENKPTVTSISESTLKSIGKNINTLPANKQFHPIIYKVYEARLKSIETGRGLDWATAEALAFGSLLQEGFGVRLSGEDVRRGTFSHRHAVLIDQNDNSRYYPLKTLLDSSENLKFQVFNSLLSEYGVLGFDYGYSIGNPNYLTIWEAQFGDFANVAQPVIDQYISGGERKWGVKSGLTMLLPHGHDGQGPEHSSARLERFLQLVDDDPLNQDFMNSSEEKQLIMSNMSVCNITEPANYFHVLRRQVLRSSYRKPLIMMSPKKLLRLKEAKNDIEDFTQVAGFRSVLPDTSKTLNPPQQVKQLMFCSGQLYYDLVERRTETGLKVNPM